MSKKNMEPTTPESRAEKLANKQALRKVFTGTFFKAFSVCLAVLLVCSVCYIAFINPSPVAPNLINPAENAAGNAVVQNGGASANGETAGNAEAGTQGATVTELTASSSQADILAYFNTAVNKVKPNAKTITVVKEINSQEGSVEGTIPASVVNIANSLINQNMGEKKDLPAPATTPEAKNAIFPVENESWSSKLTEADIESATFTEADGKYTITVKIKSDEPSETTAHGTGHVGKAMSVIMPATINENAGPAKSLIKNVKTGHSDAKITVTVDKATGNVLDANYYFVWKLSLTAVGMDIAIPFGLNKQIKVDW